jgi:hypothetical protein
MHLSIHSYSWRSSFSAAPLFPSLNFLPSLRIHTSVSRPFGIFSSNFPLFSIFVSTSAFASFGPFLPPVPLFASPSACHYACTSHCTSLYFYHSLSHSPSLSEQLYTEIDGSDVLRQVQSLRSLAKVTQAQPSLVLPAPPTVGNHHSHVIVTLFSLHPT